jgi:hypothetical protein
MYTNYSNLRFSISWKILMTSRNISDTLCSGLGSWLWWARTTDVKVCASHHFDPYDLRLYDVVVHSVSHFFLLTFLVCLFYIVFLLAVLVRILLLFHPKIFYVFLCLKWTLSYLQVWALITMSKMKSHFHFLVFKPLFIYCGIN